MIQKSIAAALALLAVFAVVSPRALAHADGDATPSTGESRKAQVESLVASLHPSTGNVPITAAKATLQLAPGYSFLPAADAQRVLTELWDNPAQPHVLGMILPGTDPHVVLDPSSWAVVVTYSDDGYVSDADAAKTDYTKMLKDMQEGMADSNPERLK